MTLHALPDDPPTFPTPIQSGEGRLLKRTTEELFEGLQHVSKQVSECDRSVNARIDAMAAGVKLDMGTMGSDIAGLTKAVVSMGRAIEQLTKREEVTGSYMIQVAGMAGEAKGLALAKKHDSHNPAAIVAHGVVWAARTIGEHWITHAILVALTALLALLARWKHL